MSWSIFKTLIQGESERQDAIVQLNNVDKENSGNQQCSIERDEQIDACISAIKSILLESGLLYHSKELSIVLRGHANKDHNKDNGWSNEFIGIEIYTKSYVGE